MKGVPVERRALVGVEVKRHVKPVVKSFGQAFYFDMLNSYGKLIRRITECSNEYAHCYETLGTLFKK